MTNSSSSNFRKMAFLLFLKLSSSLVAAQQQPAPGTDPSLVTKADCAIDYPLCYRDLANSDVNGDGRVTRDEYLGFVQTYGARQKCYNTERLSLAQQTIFNKLACWCESREGHSPGCCLGSKAHIETDGALDALRNEEQGIYLTGVCKITDGTIPCECVDEVAERDEPPIFIGRDVPQAEAAGGGLSNGAKKGIIAAVIAAALLLLLLCCCCCVIRKRRAAEEAEEEQEVVDETQQVAKVAEVPDDVETAIMEQPPSDEGSGHREPGEPEEFAQNVPAEPEPEPEPEVTPPVVPVAAVPPLQEDESESEYEEEGRKRRGNNMNPDEEDENNRRIRGAGQLPPDENNPDGIKLRPIPPKEPEEDPDWDQPGRDINFPKETDEDSAQEFDPYVPDGGVNIPQREPKEPVEYKPKWERLKKEEPEEVDDRKHRIQTGLGEGAVWDKLGEDQEQQSTGAPSGDVFDWVVQSALGVLDKSDAQAAQAL